MKLLLDTHIWVWSVLAPDRISRKVARALTQPGNELWLSPLSIWEVLMLADKGRLRLAPSAEDWIAKVLDAVPLRDAPVTREVATEVHRLELEHRDPADRFLAATAVVYGLTLVTADERLLKVRGLKTLANR